MENKINGILSDLDGVIRYFPENRNHEFEVKYSLPKDSLLKCAFDSNDLEKVIRGKITDKQWRINIASRLGKLVNIPTSEAIIQEWSNYPGLVSNETLDFFKKIKGNKAFGLLTNATDRLSSDLKDLNILNDFDFIINTSEVGFAKPEKEIFQYAQKILNLPPEQILFIDDSLKNVETAQKLGFQSHLFTDLESFKESVSKLKL